MEPRRPDRPNQPPRGGPRPAPGRPAPGRPAPSGSSGDSLLMIVDPLTREAYREGDDPAESGPLFFTTREKLDAYAREEAIEDYVVHEVPAGIVGRMRGKPYWLDGVRQ